VKYNNFFNNANNTNTTNTNVNYNDVGNGVNTNNANYTDVGNSLNNNSVSNTNVNSNGSYYGQGPFINNADVVFEDRTYLTPEEKVKDFVTGLNKKFLIFIGGIVLAIIFIILVIVLWISHINSSYKAKVIIPDIVYMGETANVSVVAQGKKDLDKTKTIRQ
jgi:hypothetical protein